MRYVYLLMVCCFSFCSAEPIFVCIAGGSGCGKTTVAEKLIEQMNEDVLIISQDFYYKDLSHLSHDERERANFDHPDSLDFDLMITHLDQLRRGEAIECPSYDFVTHTRRPESQCLRPRRVIIVEGILLLAIPELRERFDLRIYVDTDDDVRLLRRIKRDITERGRTLERVERQYLATVRPMYLQFVKPSKRYADIVVPWHGYNDIAIDLIASRFQI